MSPSLSCSFPAVARHRVVTFAAALLAVLLCVPDAAARQIPTVGTDQTFDVATWNIEWFGFTGGPTNDELQIAHVVDVMRNAGIDLWAVQEIADQSDFDRLLDSLGTPFEGHLATESSQQRIGFIYNSDIVKPRSVRHILTSFDADFATRPPLQLEADVTIADSTKRITFITVHMKCCGDASDYEKRLAAAGRLKNHIDFGALFDDPVIVLGDFNDELDRSIAGGRDTPYRAFLNDASAYRFATKPLDEGNLSTYCSNSTCSFGSTLDHILVTNELFADIESGSTGRMDALTGAIPGYVSNTSDHLPVYTRIRYGISTDIESHPLVQRNGFRVEVFPNPAVDELVVRLTAGEHCTADCYGAGARVVVYDATGRQVLTAHMGIADHELKLPLATLPAGTYFLHVTGSLGDEGTTRPFVVRR